MTTKRVGDTWNGARGGDRLEGLRLYNLHREQRRREAAYRYARPMDVDGDPQRRLAESASPGGEG